MKEGGQAIGKQCRKIRLAEQQGRFSLKCTTFHCHDTNSPFDGHSLLSQATHDTRRAKRRKGVRAPGKERRNGVMTKGLLSLWNAHGYVMVVAGEGAETGVKALGLRWRNVGGGSWEVGVKGKTFQSILSQSTSKVCKYVFMQGRQGSLPWPNIWEILS